MWCPGRGDSPLGVVPRRGVTSGGRCRGAEDEVPRRGVTFGGGGGGSWRGGLGAAARETRCPGGGDDVPRRGG